MNNRISLAVMAIVLLTGMLALALNPQNVKAESPWTWVRDTVTGAFGEAVVSTDIDIYVARGTRFYRYRSSDNSWTEMAVPPQPDGAAFKTGTALTWDFGNYLYALYGAATGDNRRWFYRYNIEENIWQTLANTPADQGEGDAITWVNTENNVYATIGGEQRPTYLARYNPITDSWSDDPADPPDGMGDGASLTWTDGDFLFALRGEDIETTPLYDFWRYSIQNNVWVPMTDIPASPHSGGSGGVGDGGSLLYIGFWVESQTDYIYALSGNQAQPDGIPDNRTYRYSISGDSWERLADLPFGVGYYVGSRLGFVSGFVYAWQGTSSSSPVGGGDDLAKAAVAVTSLQGDVDGDRDVDSSDLSALNSAYGSTPGQPNWKPSCDINSDGKVDAEDLYLLGKNYGKIYL